MKYKIKKVFQIKNKDISSVKLTPKKLEIATEALYKKLTNKKK